MAKKDTTALTLNLDIPKEQQQETFANQQNNLIWETNQFLSLDDCSQVRFLQQEVSAVSTKSFGSRQ